MIDKQKVQDAVDFVLGHDFFVQVRYLEGYAQEEVYKSLFVTVRLEREKIKVRVRYASGEINTGATLFAQSIANEYIQGANAINKYLGREEIVSTGNIDDIEGTPCGAVESKL